MTKNEDLRTTTFSVVFMCLKVDEKLPTFLSLILATQRDPKDTRERNLASTTSGPNNILLNRNIQIR